MRNPLAHDSLVLKNLQLLEKIKERHKILGYFTFIKCTKFSCIKLIHCTQTQIWYDDFNPIQDGSFWVAHGWEGQECLPSLKPVTHILQWWHLAQLYLTYRRSKNIWITWHNSCVLPIPSFFHRKISKFWYIKKCRNRLNFDT